MQVGANQLSAEHNGLNVLGDVAAVSYTWDILNFRGYSGSAITPFKPKDLNMFPFFQDHLNNKLQPLVLTALYDTVLSLCQDHFSHSNQHISLHFPAIHTV